MKKTCYRVLYRYVTKNGGKIKMKKQKTFLVVWATNDRQREIQGCFGYYTEHEMFGNYNVLPKRIGQTVIEDYTDSITTITRVS